MSAALALKFEDEMVDFDFSAMQRPRPQLYLIHFRRNINNTFGNVIPISCFRGNWELHASFEHESEMLLAFNELCRRQNVMSGLYTFRCTWPDGRTLESKVAAECLH